MEQTPRLYDLAIFAWYPDNSRITLNTQVEVVRGQFIRQAIGVPADRAYLIDPQVERHEFAHLDSIITTLTPEQYWDGKGFQLPANSEFTSPFGAFRTLNQTVSTRHTGWDMTAPTGTPVHAMSAGKVAFAGQLDIRGNHIIIDHGFGIFSGYSHLSEILVSRQQTISQGQIIGLTGNTGRGNGPHLHWEIIVNGVWVDSRQFIETWLPVGNGSG